MARAASVSGLQAGGAHAPLGWMRVGAFAGAVGRLHAVSTNVLTKRMEWGGARNGSD